MAQAALLWNETRISPTPSSPSSVLTIDTGHASQQLVPFSGAGRKRPFNEISGLDEESYAHKHLATEGSVFFRRKSRSPRSFLWRVLEDRKLLEIQCVDLVQDKKQKEESWLTFHLRFDHAIVESGVAFADPEETDALEVFVLTGGHELFTVTLRRDLLTREDVPKDFDATACWRRYASSSFTLRHPYRFHAVSSHELIVSLHDGSLMQLNREAKQNGAQWREVLYVEGGWSGTLRGWIPVKRQQTVRYGNLDVEPTAAAAIAKSPDGKHLWTVCLDHTVRIWDTQTGKVVKTVDLVQEQNDKPDQKRPQYLMSAEQGTLLQIVPSSSADEGPALSRKGDVSGYTVVVHSPRDHQFKFFNVSTTFSSIEDETLQVRDAFPRARLVPPVDELLNTNIWHLADFFFRPNPYWSSNKLWIRARSGALCKIFVLDLDHPSVFHGEDLQEDWQTRWTMVYSGQQTSEELQKCPDFPNALETTSDAAVTPSERWMDFLFSPGRYSTASLETALNIYRKARGVSTSTGRGINAPDAPLKERLASAMTSKVLMRRLPDDQPDFASYQASINAQWQTFYSLLSHLHNKRGESIGFAFDAEHALPWHVCADFVAPIRTCSTFENLSLNVKVLRDRKAWQRLDEQVRADILPSSLDEGASVTAALLFSTAKGFRGSLSADFQTNFRNAAMIESLQDRQNPEELAQTLDRMYQGHAFASEVTNEEFDALMEAAEAFEGLGTLTSDTFMAALNILIDTSPARGADGGKILDRFGDKFTLAVAQETLQRTHTVLLDLLALVIFMNGDLESDELDEAFRATDVFDAIMQELKNNQLSLWLVSNVVEGPCSRKSARAATRQSMQDAAQEEAVTLTVAETVFMGDWSSRTDGNGHSMSQLLTAWSKAWTYGFDLDKNWNGTTDHTMAELLKRKNIELAADFEKFQSDLPWSSYLRGRLHTATGDYATASLHFKAAADGLAQASSISTYDTAHLLHDHETQDFGRGPPKYYQHVSSIFEQLRIWSYTADFAAVAFHHLNDELGDDYDARLSDIDMRKSQKGSPAIQQMDDAMEEAHILYIRETRDEILCRLFGALAQTARFEEAFHALAKLSNPTLKRSNLDTLIKKCAEHDCINLLRSLPFEINDLDQLADSILLSLAKRSLASNSASSPQYHQILYAYRIDRNNYRGASEILYERLERLRYKESHYLQNPDDETLVEAYMLLINTLACCGEGEGWVLAEPIPGVHVDGRKRRLVTLEQVRGEFEKELDRRSDLALGRFPVTGLVGDASVGAGGEDVEML
ncbi:hypothetical protein MBLNU230_g6604t1 [Neophaeotheca triangularis]